MFSKLVPFMLIFLVGTIGTGWGEDRPVTHELCIHGINSNGSSCKAAVRYRVENTRRPGLIYTPEGTKRIRIELILPGEKTPSTVTDTLIYKDNRSRDLALERMDPLHAARLRGIEPQIIAPTMPGEGRFSWENNSRVVEGWIQKLGSNKRNINILGNSQAAPIVSTVLQEPKNYGLVNKVVMIDAALGSPWPTVIPGVMPGISPALKENKLGSQALQKVFARWPQVDPGTDWTFLNTKSGVVSQPMMEKAVTTFQGAGIKAKLIYDPQLLYNTPETPPGSGPGTNKGFVHSNPVPEITGRGPHGMEQFLQYANFDTLFKGWTFNPSSVAGGQVLGLDGRSLTGKLVQDSTKIIIDNSFKDIEKSLIQLNKNERYRDISIPKIERYQDISIPIDPSLRRR
jgi:hypothetical protein